MHTTRWLKLVPALLALTAGVAGCSSSRVWPGDGSAVGESDAAIVGDGCLGTCAGDLGDACSGSPSECATGGAAAIQLSAGGEHTCALRISGSVACWGNNTYGQPCSSAFMCPSERTSFTRASLGSTASPFASPSAAQSTAGCLGRSDSR